jgi:cardiolipin synthase A/B
VNGTWHAGNSVDLLENGEEYFPAVFEAIGQANQEVLIETFILFDDPVGQALRERLVEAARRGVRCHLLLDGYGCSELPREFLGSLTEVGVRIDLFDPVKRIFGKSARVFRRMHRKLVVVDGTVAFCGGINFSQEHLYEFGALSKQDYAVRLRGPVVREIQEFVWTSKPMQGRPTRGDTRPGVHGAADVRFVVRDNHQCRTQIEAAYLAGIRAARDRVVIANAYFFPGYRVLRELRRAARRGVDVTLILQGRPDMAFVMSASRMVYGFLLEGGVSVYEYGDRPLHGKVALVDREWATVGSSNLDPLSLSVNLEANVLIRDREFNRRLMQSLQRIRAEACVKVDLETLPPSTLWEFLRGRLVFHFLRRFPAWFDLLPAHTPRLTSAASQVAPRAARQLAEGVAMPTAGDGAAPTDGVSG